MIWLTSVRFIFDILGEAKVNDDRVPFTIDKHILCMKNKKEQA